VSDPDWWVSPVDKHRHALSRGRSPDECPVCALEAKNERLQAEVDTWRALAWKASSDADRLRAVVQAAKRASFLYESRLATDGDLVDQLRPAMRDLDRALSGLDISEPMGGLPPHHVAPGEGVEGYLRRTADENDPVNWAFEPSRERPTEGDR
jgi:hypothetical protein